MAKRNRAAGGRKSTVRTTCGYLAVVVAGVAVTGEAVAADSVRRGPDIVNRNQTVFERSRPIYDAKGLTIGGGGLLLFPSLELSETYDDNVYAQSSNKSDDFETIIAPRLTLQSNWTRHSFSVSTYGNFHRYADLKTENNKEYGVTANGALDLPRDSSLVAKGGYQRITVLRGDPEQSNGLASPPEQVDLTQAGLDYSHPFGRVRLTLGGEVRNFKTVDGADPNAERTDYTGKVRAAYEISAALNAFVEPYYTTRRYRAPAVNRDVDIFGVGFGFAYDITGKLYGETQVGYYTAKFDSPTFSDSSGVFVRSQATWNLSALTSIIAGIERGNQASNVGTASSSTASSIDLRLERELARNVTAALTARYQRQTFEDFGGGRQDNFYTVGWIANYLLDRHVSLYLRYDYENRQSDLGTAEYRDNQITLGIRGQI